jgi:hypothetical protein
MPSPKPPTQGRRLWSNEAFDRSTAMIGFGRVLNTKAEHNDRHHLASLAVIGDRECCMLPPIKERWLCQIIKPTSFLEMATTLELSILSASTMTLQRDLLSSSRISVMSSYGSTPAKFRSLAANLTEGQSPRASLLLISLSSPPDQRLASPTAISLTFLPMRVASVRSESPLCSPLLIWIMTASAKSRILNIKAFNHDAASTKRPPRCAHRLV